MKSSALRRLDGGVFVRKALITVFAVVLLLLILPGCLPKLPEDLKEAIEIVKAILPGEIPQGSEYICSFYSKKLVLGTTIDLENPSAIVDGAIGATSATNNKIVVTEPSYLFLLDLDPGSFFAHPVKAIVVGDSGQHRIISGKWLPRVDEVVPDELKLPFPKKERLIDLNREAVRFYNYLLLDHPVGKKALNYLVSERGLEIETIKEFQLGFSPDNSYALKKFLVDKKKFTPSEVERAGIGIARGQNLYDRFLY